MNAIVQSLSGELVDDAAQFFAPVTSDFFDSLVGQYNAERAKIEQIAGYFDAQKQGALGYFLSGNCQDDRNRYGLPSVERIFQAEGAIAALNAAFWDRALKMTDVLDCMPQKRREEWFEKIREMTTPEFSEESVRPTITGLLMQRQKFFAERVDGIFRALSRTHVTNCPQGFSKRMILARAICSYGTINHATAGYINDLRCVIAKFMGRDEPSWDATGGVIRAAKEQSGQWMRVDGGALRIRVYGGVGTAHIEVHPDMAWRLNGVLASLYPAAIPSEFRTKPKRKVKDFQLFDRPLPFAVLAILESAKPAHERREEVRFNEPKFKTIPNTLRFDLVRYEKAAMAEAEKVMAAIGGTCDKSCGYEFWRFHYDPAPIISEIICSGCIPDHRSHQYYPTPGSVATVAVEMAQIGDKHICLEPSAGTGSLADLMPQDRTTCMEISGLHCKVLEAKGHSVIAGDFLEWADSTYARFDRVVMNPPFSEGRWQAHIEHAAGLVKAGGRLVAILPSSAKNKDLLPGWACEWSQVFSNEFAGTSVSVVILCADLPA